MESPNPYAPPASSASVALPLSEERINALDVSPEWKERFIAISRAGGSKLPLFKQLAKPERRKAMSMNFLAFFFGPIYYIIKGMWKRGLIYFVLGAVVIVILGMMLEHLGFRTIARSLHFGLAAIYGMRANIDFYKKNVEGDNGWW
ncbi:hypothetical protein ACVW0Y_004436 [Pseudomonas sp. TE3786]